jgi:lysozyme family protein
MTTSLEADNTERWHAMAILPHYAPLFAHVANELVANKARYLQTQVDTRVPWAIVAVIHEREASQSWHANLAQGDPWDRPSIHVPRGRGPFHSWEAAACDALLKCPPYTGQNDDWSIGRALVALEEYNGLGYEKYHHMASPYLWAGSNQYLQGKYVADGHFDPEAVDHQLGCAGLLRAMMALDDTITFASTTTTTET